MGEADGRSHARAAAADRACPRHLRHGGWRVGIADDIGFDGGPAAERHPQPAATAAGDSGGHVVLIHTGGLATSGTAVRSWRRGSARLHHIIVPATGLPAASCWRAVSVAAATCIAANTASTAAILRSERATAWLTGLGLPARLVRHDGTAVTVAGWPEDAPPDSPLAAGRSAGASAAGRPADPLATPDISAGHRSHGH